MSEVKMYINLAKSYSQWIDESEQMFQRGNLLLGIAAKNLKAAVATNNPEMIDGYVAWLEQILDSNSRALTALKVADNNLDACLLKIDELTT